jgi:release factor glutamine methyltransferase
MLIKTYRDQFKAKLIDLYDENEVDNFFYMLLETYNNLKKYQLALEPGLVLTPNDLALWDEAVMLLQNYKPIQYIIGKTYFYEGVFNVTPATLIPRPETEELVDLIIKQANNLSNIKVLDIGTGTGCIAISLAAFLNNANVTAFDVSEDALKVAQSNAVLNQVKVNFVLQDILQVNKLSNNFDIIVSNPPYVRNLEKIEIKPNVLNHEPHLALFVEDNDPLIFYKKITELATQSLNENGVLYFEINQYLGPETVEMIENFKVFKSVELIKDMYGNDRMIVAKK